MERFVDNYIFLSICFCLVCTYYITSKLNNKIEYLTTNIKAGVGGSGWAFFCEVHDIEFNGDKVQYTLIKMPETEKAMTLINKLGYDVSFEKIKDERYRLNLIDKFTKEFPLAKDKGMNKFIYKLGKKEGIIWYDDK